MKKKVFIFIIFITFGIIYLYNQNNSKTFKEEGAIIALTIDGETKASFPTNGLYTADIDCENGLGKWLPKEDGTGYEFVLENITKDATCNISLSSKTSADTLINTIQSIKTKTNNSGICTNETYTTKSTCEANNEIWWGVYDENGLRYEGKNPNNYIWFNNELWRIIGYLPTKNQSSTATNLVKIVRMESLNSLVVNDASGSLGSTYIGSWLYTVLNTYYYNATDGTNSGYCYSDSSTSTNIPISCDYTYEGLTSLSKRMIVPVQYAIGTQGSESTAATHYTTETGTYTTQSGGINVGLMSTSDYAYSVQAEYCGRDTTVDLYNTDTCAGKSWLYSQGFEWTISPYSATYLWSIDLDGIVSNSRPREGYSVRPTLYLNSSVYVISGTGSESDPYIIGM